jgi:hypothetical protein
MRKFIIAGMAVAMLAVIPSVASADVPRYQDNQQATFTLKQPVVYSDGSHAGEFGYWQHDVTVKVNPCDNTFVGTAKVSATDKTWGAPVLDDENLTGSFGADGTVSFTLTRTGYNGVETLVGAKMDGSLVHPTTTGPEQYEIDMTVTAPTFSNIVGGITYKNHGDYVKGVGGGADAAHSCIGMPIVSSK